MSKSLGNTVSPGAMVKEFGADTVRLFILYGANPEAGMDWSDNAIISNHKQMQSIIDAFESSRTLLEESSIIDNWLLSRMRINYIRWKNAMENVSLREGVMISHFEMLSDWQWYKRRGVRIMKPLKPSLDNGFQCLLQQPLILLKSFGQELVVKEWFVS